LGTFLKLKVINDKMIENGHANGLLFEFSLTLGVFNIEGFQS